MENMNDYPDQYSNLITDYPYIGWNNVLGGGGRDPGADIYVPPQTNLYGTDMGMGALASMPIVTLIVGMAIGFYVVPRVVKAIKKAS